VVNDGTHEALLTSSQKIGLSSILWEPRGRAALQGRVPVRYEERPLGPGLTGAEAQVLWIMPTRR